MKPRLKDLQQTPQQASVPRGGEYDPKETVADRKMSSDGAGERFDDPVSHDSVHMKETS